MWLKKIIFLNSPGLDQELIDKITTSLKIKKSVGKYIYIGVGIVHDSMVDDDYSTRVLVLDTHPEDSEHMKDFDGNIID